MSQSKIDQYRALHEGGLYGATSEKDFRHLAAQAAGLRPRSIVDFGCGQSRLVEMVARHVGARAARYDPAIEGCSVKPEGRFDLLLNTDVLEHVPLAEIDALLAEMRAMADHALFIIDLRPAATILPNGENAHCSLYPADWWRARLEGHYDRVIPIAVQHRGRAAFRTWDATPAIQARYTSSRVTLELGRLLGHVTGARRKRRRTV